MTRFILSIIFLFVAPAWSQDVSHFRRAEIPRNESRLSELARVREFRIDYEMARYSNSSILIAEVYRDGKCIQRYRLSHAVNTTAKESNTGVISIGWQRDGHNLVCVHDNGNVYSPWTGSAHLPDFSPFDAYYFTDSLPEKRKSDKHGVDFELSPVIGLCGERYSQINYPKNGNAQSFLEACKNAESKDAVIIYLYSTDGGDAPVEYTKTIQKE